MAAVLTVLNISSRGRVLSSQVRKPPAEVAAWLEQCTEQVLFKAFIDLRRMLTPHIRQDYGYRRGRGVKVRV